jgi:predicted Zn-dependent peptidase
MSFDWQIDTLENGLRVVTTPMPASESVSVNVFVGVGSRAETPRTNGLSHYIEHMLFKGTSKRPTAIDIAETIEGAGGVLNAYTTQELTCYWNHMPYDKLDVAVDVLADMLMHSTIDQVELDKERTVVQQEIKRGYDQPGAWAGRLLSQACFGDEPLGWSVAGSEETVGEMTREDFIDHISTWYVPANMVLSVAGNTTHEHVVELARSLLGDAAAKTPPDVPPAAQSLPERNVVVESRDITQSNLNLALRCVSRLDPDRYAVMLLNAVLGRGMSSRLFKEVREERGLAYSIGSGATRYIDAGLLNISAGVSPENVIETIDVIKQELWKLAEQAVPNEELAKARDYTIGSFRLSLETSGALGQRAGEQLLMMGEIEPVEEAVAKLEAITPDDVQRVAERFFRKDNLALSLVGPDADEAKLAEALAA